MKEVTTEEKRRTLEGVLNNPTAVDILFEAYCAQGENRWAESPFVNEKRRILEFVRGIRADQLPKLRRAVHMIQQGHSFTKRFEALQSFRVVQGEQRVKIEAGANLEMVDHGWRIRKSGDRETHHQRLEVHNSSGEVITIIDITDRTLTRLLDTQKLRGLP